MTVGHGSVGKMDRSNPQAKNLIKHMFLSSILGYKKQFRTYGEIVLAIDARDGYWRKDYFPWYKGHRKHSNAKSDIDWSFVYECIDEMKADLKDNFIYKMVQVSKAEADDVIAVLCEYLQTHELVQEGVFDSEPQKIMIVSADGDFGQLQKFSNVEQWSPILKKKVKNANPYEYMIEHICEGDAGDNIPNIVTPDKWAQDRADNIKTRANPLKKDRIRDFVLKGEGACSNEQEKSHWKRNKKLIDLTEVPTSLQYAIVDTYKTAKPEGSKTKMMTYFMKNKMKILLESLSEF